ncbi:class I SAM-dependent methyltransferase [Taibaiella soli]|uniref:SAM-dependent methyltransferase n=1 Tax=Taibaiella soli TaxID=1649169 RepID=A0A2W2A9Z3_9BACT|nr:class I SAM-dependent methyltransferase [Taibaiella soli]PZF72215.1 SAM-dependent methyltransferase [Taibaiella soli]
MSEVSVKKPALFEDDKMSALEAISQAQFIAFAPYVFQASMLLRDKGILKEVEASRQNGITIEALEAKLNLPHYTLRILLEAGLGIKLVYRKEDKYFLSKLGHFFLNHPMTRVNADFMRDVCYDGAQDLDQSLTDGKPRGLRHLGSWDTIYQGLSILPEPAHSSWFNFDHYYSDNAFPEALPIVFESAPKKVMDIGANTGKFTLSCLNYDKEVHVGLVDLQVQLNVAQKNIEAEGFGDRVSYHTCNVLDAASRLPTGFDIIWMSQFLDCFADDEIVSILQKCHEALPDNGHVFINETFWDRQKFEASAFSLQMTSLYFTTMANGNSQMYDSAVFLKLVDRAGFEVTKDIDNLGVSHTILVLKKK